MELEEFRKSTESLNDSAKSKIVFHGKIYGKDNIINILKTITFLKQKS